MITVIIHRKLISKITASGYFRLDKYTASYKDAMQEIENDKADIILEIPASFEKNLVKESSSNLFMAVNASMELKLVLVILPANHHSGF